MKWRMYRPISRDPDSGFLKLGHIGRRRQFRRAYFRSFVPFSPKLRPQPQLFPMYFPLWNREHYLSRTNFSNICFSIKITKICFPHLEIPKKFELIRSTVHIQKSVELMRLPTIICGSPLLHKYETRKKRRRLRVGLNQVWKSSPQGIIGQVVSLHLPRLSSTDGDWDNLGGNMGCIYVHSHRHTNKNIDTQI